MYILPIFSLKNNFAVGEWVVGGNSNASKSIEERWGRISGNILSEIEDFGCFIELKDLVDVPVVGCIYT